MVGDDHQRMLVHPPADLADAHAEDRGTRHDDKKTGIRRRSGRPSATAMAWNGRSASVTAPSVAKRRRGAASAAVHGAKFAARIRQPAAIIPERREAINAPRVRRDRAGARARSRALPCRRVVAGDGGRRLAKAGGAVETAAPAALPSSTSRNTGRAIAGEPAQVQVEQLAGEPALASARGRPRSTGIPASSAAMRDRMKPASARPTVARCGDHIAVEQQALELVFGSSRAETRRRAASASAAASGRRLPRAPARRAGGELAQETGSSSWQCAAVLRLRVGRAQIERLHGSDGNSAAAARRCATQSMSDAHRIDEERVGVHSRARRWPSEVRRDCRQGARVRRPRRARRRARSRARGWISGAPAGAEELQVDLLVAGIDRGGERACTSSIAM